MDSRVRELSFEDESAISIQCHQEVYEFRVTKCLVYELDREDAPMVMPIYRYVDTRMDGGWSIATEIPQICSLIRQGQNYKLLLLP